MRKYIVLPILTLIVGLAIGLYIGESRLHDYQRYVGLTITRLDTTITAPQQDQIIDVFAANIEMANPIRRFPRFDSPIAVGGSQIEIFWYTLQHRMKIDEWSYSEVRTSEETDRLIRYLCARICSGNAHTVGVLTIVTGEHEFEALNTYPNDALERNREWLEAMADHIWDQPPTQVTSRMGLFLAGHCDQRWAWDKLWHYWNRWDLLGMNDPKCASMRFVWAAVHETARSNPYAAEMRRRITKTQRLSNLMIIPKVRNGTVDGDEPVDVTFPEKTPAPFDQH